MLIYWIDNYVAFAKRCVKGLFQFLVKYGKPNVTIYYCCILEPHLNNSKGIKKAWTLKEKYNRKWYNSLNELSANEGSWKVDGCMVVYLAGWKKLNAPPSVGRPAKSRPVYIDTAVSDTKPFSCHIFASSITHRKIFNCPLCSYTGAIWLSSGQCNVGRSNISHLQVKIINHSGLSSCSLYLST